jgi:hypothetical protein
VRTASGNATCKLGGEGAGIAYPPRADFDEGFLEFFAPRLADGFLADRPFTAGRAALTGVRLSPSSSRRLTAATAFGGSPEDLRRCRRTMFSAITVAAATAAALAALLMMDFTPRTVSFCLPCRMCVVLR